MPYGREMSWTAPAERSGDGAFVWIGDVFSSGKPEHRTHFRSIADWYQIGPCMGNYTCGSTFKPGSFRRCNENLNGQRFLVIESDTLAKDEVGAGTPGSMRRATGCWRRG